MNRNVTLETGHQGVVNLAPGTIVSGTYQIQRCLGFGSVGVVYSCVHRDLPDRPFAIKFLHAPSGEMDPNSSMVRFRNELIASYQVNHPNVVRALDYIEADGHLAFTMEYISGGDLWSKIREYDLLTLHSVIDLLSQICSGVQAIHNVGIVHRDLKPENILLAEDGTVKITDFGIARIKNSRHCTEQGKFIGTFDYMSPEYLKGAQCDERSDIFAIGIIGYMLLTGQSPFGDLSLAESILSRAEFKAIPPHEVNDRCPAPLSAAIMRALQPNPEERYQTAHEMLYHLAALRFSAHRAGRQHRLTSTSINNDLIREGCAGELPDKSEQDKIVKTPLVPASSFASPPIGRRNPIHVAFLGATLGCVGVFAAALGYPSAVEQVGPFVKGAVERLTAEFSEDPLLEIDGLQDRNLATKATLLYKFLNFTPEGSAPSEATLSTVTICILGKDVFGKYLDRVTSQTRTIRNERLSIRRIPVSEAATTSLSSCHIAYVNATDERFFERAIKREESRKMLVVSDGTGHGAIDFYSDSRTGGVAFKVSDKSNLPPSLQSLSRLSAEQGSSGSEDKQS